MVEIISGVLVSTTVTVMDVSCRRVLSNSVPLCVSVLIEIDVFVEAETVCFPVVLGINVDSVALGTTDSNDIWGAELVASTLLTVFCEFLVPFRVAKFEGMLLLQCKVEVVTVVVLVSHILLLVLGVALSLVVINPDELRGSCNVDAGPQVSRRLAARVSRGLHRCAEYARPSFPILLLGYALLLTPLSESLRLIPV